MNFGAGGEFDKLELAMRAAGMAWWWMELPSGVVFFSPNKTAMLDRHAADFVHYKDFTKLVHEDDYEPMMQDMRDHLEGRDPLYHTVYRIRVADGSYRRFFDRGKIISKSPSGTIALAGMVMDVTDIPEFTAADKART
jgi:PAS domain S-box-containing protein